jgi:hypothetical protein
MRIGDKEGQGSSEQEGRSEVEALNEDLCY